MRKTKIDEITYIQKSFISLTPGFFQGVGQGGEGQGGAGGGENESVEKFEGKKEESKMAQTVKTGKPINLKNDQLLLTVEKNN